MNVNAAKVLSLISMRRGEWRRKVQEVYREMGGAEKKISMGDMASEEWNRRYPNSDDI